MALRVRTGKGSRGAVADFAERLGIELTPHQRVMLGEVERLRAVDATLVVALFSRRRVQLNGSTRRMTWDFGDN